MGREGLPLHGMGQLPPHCCPMPPTSPLLAQLRPPEMLLLPHARAQARLGLDLSGFPAEFTVASVMDSTVRSMSHVSTSLSGAASASDSGTWASSCVMVPSSSVASAPVVPSIDVMTASSLSGMIHAVSLNAASLSAMISPPAGSPSTASASATKSTVSASSILFVCSSVRRRRREVQCERVWGE